MPKKVLGKGLDALLTNTENNIENNHDILKIPIRNIVPNDLQPRKSFDFEKLQELADSIREKGVIQPIVVQTKK